MYSPIRVALGFVLMVVCCAAAAFAQGGTGQLSGNVVDANGAVVPGATVKLTSGGTKLTITRDGLSALRLSSNEPSSS